MSLRKEIAFESEIGAHLAANGWLYAEGDATQYDRALALFGADVVPWVRETQLTAWVAIEKNHGTCAADTLLA